MFRDQLESQLPLISANISVLKEQKSNPEALNELFRYFHTYKSSSAYLNLTLLNELVSKTETVLSSLRERNSVVQESIIEWLCEIEKQLTLYIEEMQNNETTLSPLPSRLLEKIQITAPYFSPNKKLKTLSLLYMDQNSKRASKVVPFLNRLVKNAEHSTEEDTQNTVFNLAPFDIVMINLAKDNYQAINFIQTNFSKIIIVPIFDKISEVELSKLLKKGLSHFLVNPLNAKEIQRELISIVKAHHSSSNIVIENKKINKFVQTLQPLPDTIFKIISICDDEESSVKELIKTVKSDPILAANILKVANSPIYGSINLKTIDQAVTKFGKRAIKALSVSGIYSSFGSIDLSAYDINEETFSKIGMSRLSLMLRWYAKVSIADLSLLSSTAILGNIGQLLISKELVQTEEKEQFIELCKVYSIKYAEEFTLNTTTSYISSKILRHLKLSADIVEIIEYSDSPKDASDELKQLCVANHIVNTLVDLKGNISDEIPETTLKLMKEFELNPDILNKALVSIQKNR